MFTPRIITDTIQEPVTAAFLKAHARIDSAAEDDLVDLYISAARRYFEERAAYTVHEKTFEIVLDGWPDGEEILLPRATPLIAITSLKYKDSSGAETTWDSTNYIADTDNIPGRLVLGYQISWPSVTLYPANPIRVRYRGGIATSSPITDAPADIRLLVCQVGAHFFNNRESVVINDRGVAISDEVLKLTVDALIRPYIQYRF